MNMVTMAIIAAMAQASAVPVAPNQPRAVAPIDCPSANFSTADAMAVGGLAGRGNANPTPAETAANERLKAATIACEGRLKWSKPKANFAYAHARANALSTFAKSRITARRLPVSAVERTYAKMTPAMKQGLLAQRPDPMMQTILIAELKAAKINPANVTRDDGRFMGNLLAAMATQEKARADFSASR